MLGEETEIELADEFDIDVVDDTPEQDRGRPLLPEDKEELEEPSEDELASYSDRVKKRISDATFKFHDQRRKREAAEREKNEAIKFAKAQLEEARALREAVQKYEAGFVEQAKGRVDVELEEAKRSLKAAYDIGDPDKMAEAQAKIAKLAVQQDTYSRYQPQELPAQEELPDSSNPRVDMDDEARKFNSWREKNKWFDSDETLREYALGVHAKIVSENPESVGSESYYEEIERRVRRTFPTKFESNQDSTPRPSPVVGVVRTQSGNSQGSAKKVVKLTASQRDLCRKLNIDPRDYAKQLLMIGE